MADHASCVAAMARCFAAGFAPDEAELAGLLHDLGKYGDRFQLRLRGLDKGLDHWSAGAWVALRELRSVAAAMAIQGHHIGLQQMDRDSLLGLDPARLSVLHPLGLSLTEPDTALLLRRLDADGISVPQRPDVTGSHVLERTAAAMLDVRMLFSALVDADFLDTEAHYQAVISDPEKRAAGVTLDPARALSELSKHVAALGQRSEAAPAVKRLRSDLWDACLVAGSTPVGVATLSAPTGTGKTLAMLGWALRHAARHQLRRVIVVLPYLSIIEQTAQTYLRIFRPRFGDGYVLEHHSLAGTRASAGGPQGTGRDAEDEGTRRGRLLAENWDAPLIITTSVQFLESLFSNRPSACRKLHRLAESVVLFDEVQTLPLPLALPTLAALSHLSERYRTSVLFATATQPAFSHLDGQLRKLHSTSWQPRELASAELKLYERARRTETDWSLAENPVPWEQLSQQLADEPQVLCVVNLKRHAHVLATALHGLDASSIFHLSTNMCPAHRQSVLAQVRGRLQEGRECRVVSTQCVEAGVDLDFPVVYRAFAPLEAIAQAAGRCNRNGGPAMGRVRVVLPEEDRYPSRAYEQAALVTRWLLKERGAAGMDINDPGLFRDYYLRLYDLAQPEAMKPELANAIRAQDFAEVARLYRIIDDDSINILVPYDLPRYEELADTARRLGIRSGWIRQARPHTVSLFRPAPTAGVWAYLEPAPITASETSDEWFIYLVSEHYHSGPADLDLGLLPPDTPPVWIV